MTQQPCSWASMSKKQIMFTQEPRCRCSGQLYMKHSKTGNEHNAPKKRTGKQTRTYLHTTEYYSVLKRNSLLIHTRIQSVSYYATWCEESTHWKRILMLGKIEGRKNRGNRRWDGWMASLTQRTWVWANSWRRWRIGKPGVLQSTGLQRVRHDLATEQQGH